MTAKEKFYARAKELGLEAFNNEGFGHYGVETEGGIIILVHEAEFDDFDELRYPSMKELSKDGNMRDKIFDSYDSIEDFDKETIGALYLWKILGVFDDYSYPEEAGYSGVYFACEPNKRIQFKDDVDEETIQIIKNMSVNELIEFVNTCFSTMPEGDFIYLMSDETAWNIFESAGAGHIYEYFRNSTESFDFDNTYFYWDLDVKKLISFDSADELRKIVTMDVLVENYKQMYA